MTHHIALGHISLKNVAGIVDRAKKESKLPLTLAW
jgi:hypothetical protein